MSRRLGVNKVLVCFAAAGLLGTAATVAFASEAELTSKYQPDYFAGNKVSILDALKLTLANSPEILLQLEDAAEKRGQAQEASGQFDTVVKGSLSYQYEQKPLLVSEQKKQRDARESLDQKADQKQSEIDEQEARIIEFQRAREVLLAGGDLASVTFSDPNDAAAWLVMRATLASANAANRDLIVQTVLEWIDRNIAASNDALNRSWETCKVVIDPQYKNSCHQEEIEADPDDESDREGLRCQLARLQKKRLCLGDYPLAEKSYSGSFNVEVSTLYRTGVTVSPYFKLNGSGSNYQDKTKNVEWGGKGTSDSYDAKFGFKIITPLGRGRGEEVASAQERSAQLNADAAQRRAEHAAAKACHDTMEAYWGLVAAQEDLDVQEKLLALNEEILEVTKERIKADLMPRAELPRAEAQRAESRAKVEQSRRSVHEARISLAKAMGLKADDVSKTPLAADKFPSLPDDATMAALNADALFQAALESRGDYLAARIAEEAGEALYIAATDGIKRKVDLTTEMWYSAVNRHSNTYKGIINTLIHKWGGPSVLMKLDFELPVANNAQQGQLVQKRALYNRQLITTEDLKRVMQADIALAVGTARQVVEQYRNHAAAGELYRQSVETEREKLRMGTTTLIDVLNTVQNEFNARLQVVNAAKSYAQLLSKLRFESGTLVSKGPDGNAIAASDIVSLPVTR